MQRLITRLLVRGVGAGLGLVLVAFGGGGASFAQTGGGSPAAPRIELTLSQAGTLEVRGQLPPGLSRRSLREMFPQVGFADALAGGEGSNEPTGWRRALEAINIALPRIERARIVLTDGVLEIDGRLREGFAAREVQAALRLGLGPDWDLAFALREVPPAPRITFWAAPERLEIEGIVPDGLSPRHALTTLGATEDWQVSGAFTGGGSGDSAAWATALGVVGRLLPAFARAEGSLTDGRIDLDGELAPGQRPEALAIWAMSALPEAWEIALSGEVAEATPGARRYDVASGGTARLLHGHWLPEVAFEPTVAECDGRMAQTLRKRRLTFASGASTLSDGSGPVLDRLAAVAMTCLGRFGMRLKVGGHTDDRGSDEDNRALSRARAEAVRRALEARGIPPAAVVPEGYGSASPIASNETAEGRRRNRRITFDWSLEPS